MRIGFGYDIHRLVRGRLLVLGGVTIPSDLGLEGHSDADVVLHALMDALLGAAALGDIGRHFPNTEPQWKGVASTVLLSKVSQLLKERDYRVINADITLVLESPKVMRHADEMRSLIAGILEAPADAISVKATTSDGLGFVGAREGAAAYAVALIE